MRVLVVDSADPEFFSAHADVTLIQAIPTDDTSLHVELTGFQAMVDRFRTMPKATIAVIEGIAAAAGASSPCRATCGSPRWSARCWPNPRCRSGPSPAVAAPSGCPR